jgi:predicted MPP superfamily phosphohydrolase
MNESARVPLDGADLWLIGVDDPSQDRDRLDIASRGVPDEAPKIMLAHSPEIVTRLHRVPVDLVVCGHTHGGQVCPPSGQALWTQTPALERSSLGYGAFGPEDFTPYNPNPLSRPRMYVSRGVGTAKLPIRAFCRPEVALLILRSIEPDAGSGA